ncbi:MAG: hypothetical protein IKE74_04560 [Mogibacterium sp.]|nr:hypothetical protein [Mogibacterium sp.]
MGYGVKEIDVDCIYETGGIITRIDGEKDDPYYCAFKDYFSERRTTIGCEEITPDLVITIGKNGDKIQFDPDLFSLSGSISFNKEAYRIIKSNYLYTVKNLFASDKTTEVCFTPVETKKNSIKRIHSSIIGSRISELGKYNAFVDDIANYSCLWYIFAMTLMKKRSLFVHCGMMSKNNRGLILTGTSGCGKTSTMMELITNSGYSYMAEDFGVLRFDGAMFDMQKKAAVYQSDIKWGNQYLKRAYSNLRLQLRINWEIKKLIGSNPHHFFKPAEIFASNIMHESKVDTGFFLKRIPQNKALVCGNIDSQTFAERMKTASFRELKELYEILSNIRAVGGEEYYDYYPSIHELEKRYTSIANDALTGVECYEIAVPLNVDPVDTANSILSISERDN